MNNFLTDLTLEKKEWFVVVKILSIWNHPPKHPNDHTSMILVDNKGTRIDAVVPPDSYKRDFPRYLKEGEWYFLWDFDVIPPSLRERNSNHPYQLRFNNKTTMAHYKQKYTSEFLQCLAFPRINNPSEEDKQFVVDVVGLVRSVSPIGRLLEGGSDLDSSYVTFKLKDLAGHSINCVAKGSFCEEFVRKYSRRISDVNYHNQPIMVVLRFWRISEFGGKPCLITKGGCPRMFIDENFSDINRDCYICFFTAGNKETASSDDDNVSDENGDSN